ncbi:hypothetical protein [Inquilinus sp. CAU 1745]|uniref:hypothetical protein n=1 Tax=Inquilinus sp. CAU 1745 TaxID=3140369 RepID=UPI00325ACE48
MSIVGKLTAQLDELKRKIADSRAVRHERQGAALELLTALERKFTAQRQELGDLRRQVQRLESERAAIFQQVGQLVAAVEATIDDRDQLLDAVEAWASTEMPETPKAAPAPEPDPAPASRPPTPVPESAPAVSAQSPRPAERILRHRVDGSVEIAPAPLGPRPGDGPEIRRVYEEYQRRSPQR